MESKKGGSCENIHIFVGDKKANSSEWHLPFATYLSSAYTMQSWTCSLLSCNTSKCVPSLCVWKVFGKVCGESSTDSSNSGFDGAWYLFCCWRAERPKAPTVQTDQIGKLQDSGFASWIQFGIPLAESADPLLIPAGFSAADSHLVKKSSCSEYLRDDTLGNTLVGRQDVIYSISL